MHHDKAGAIQICCELVCDGGSAIDILLLATAKYYVHDNCFCIADHQFMLCSRKHLMDA